MSFFSWVDFFMNPYNIFMFGIAGAILTWFITAGVMFTLGVNRKLGMRITIIMTVLSLLLIWLCGWGVYIWYNTPMGPPLNLVPPSE